MKLRLRTPVLAYPEAVRFYELRFNPLMIKITYQILWEDQLRLLIGVKFICEYKKKKRMLEKEFSMTT